MKLNISVEHITLISDSFNYQYRNKCLTSVLRFLVKAETINIEQLFITKDHTIVGVSNFETLFKPLIYSPSD